MSFETRVQLVNGKYFLPIPTRVMEKYQLSPFVAGKLQFTGKKQIVLSDFKPLVKIKVDLDEETLSLAREIMRREGYGSLDETLSNAIHHLWVQKMNLKEEHGIVYLYPEGFLQSGIELIDEYEKKTEKGGNKNGKENKKRAKNSS